jgi:peptide/nickel transport system substrate-binding protein
MPFMRRRTLLQAALSSPLALPSIARAEKTATLRFIPQANLTSLDPVWTTATVTNNHGYYVYDTLYASAQDMRPKPQMAEGHEVSADGRVWRIKLREGLKFHGGNREAGGNRPARRDRRRISTRLLALRFCLRSRWC